ncbi:synaptotagmin-1-like [Lytechinus variegatus]|uniref:synaptotagmin-1-like n=1 Tax=Lytechinus variegatus TaxID=7654 RepID=UPI001BB2B921|nr:synaptotagmin-1-like [Lytechinus variegatus]
MGAANSTRDSASESSSAPKESGQNGQNFRSDNERVMQLARAMTTAKKRRHQTPSSLMASQGSDFETYNESIFILKQLFKRMDPAVTKTLGDAKGEVKLSLKYDKRRSMLLVKVVSARDLSAKDIRGRTSDPYVQMDLIPDPHDEGKKSTQYVKKTLSPTYNEIFTFKLNEEEISETQLRVRVLSHDPFGKADFMGENIIQLGRMDFSDIITSWFELQLETDLDIQGELKITLTYQLPDTLKVRVHNAEGLVCRDPKKMPYPYVKVLIPGIHKVEETKVQKNTLDPVWDETFDFSLAQEEFANRYLVLHVLDKALIGDSEDMGQVFIDLDNLDINQGFSGNFPLTDLKNSERTRTKWSQTATVQEFREAMYAHSVYRYPGLVFQKHRGNKVLTVHSRKAGSSAKVRIVNGIPT